MNYKITDIFTGEHRDCYFLQCKHSLKNIYWSCLETLQPQGAKKSSDPSYIKYTEVSCWSITRADLC